MATKKTTRRKAAKRPAQPKRRRNLFGTSRYAALPKGALQKWRERGERAAHEGKSLADGLRPHLGELDEMTAADASRARGEAKRGFEVGKKRRREKNPRKAKAGTWVDLGGRKKVRVVKRGGRVVLEAK